jgi:hypothetical protein
MCEDEYPKTSPEIDNSANEKETLLALSKKKWGLGFRFFFLYQDLAVIT